MRFIAVSGMAFVTVCLAVAGVMLISTATGDAEYSLLSNNKWPVRYECILSEQSSDLELQFCQEFKAVLGGNEFISYNYDESRPYFFVVVLTTERNAHIGATIAVDFIYPPLDGLAISSFYGNYLIEPEGVGKAHVYRFIVKRLVMQTAEWMVWARPILLQLNHRGRPVLEA